MAARRSIRTAKQGTQQRSAPKSAAPKRPAAKRPAAKRLRAAEFRPAFAEQRHAASAKDLLLFELQRARVVVLAALQGVPGGAAERPLRPGGWTIREVVLHLIVRDRARLEEFEPALAGTPVSWTGVGHEAMAAINESHLQPLRALSWDEAIRMLHTTRAELIERLVVVPPEPVEVWTVQHAFGAMLHTLPGHDRHHAESIKHARMQG
jgi:hypothetical protein